MTVSLSKVYDSNGVQVRALDNVDFSVDRGEFVSVVGPSGSGKSTLLNLLGALDRPSSGKILIDGVDVFKADSDEIARIRNLKIGFIFQSYNLINRASVLKNVELPAIIANVGKEERNKRALTLLERLGVLDKSNTTPNTLSGGQQQRVAIARALINNPTIVLADEPTGNLDTKTGSEVFGLLKELNREQKVTVIMVTHNHELASQVDRIIRLRDGRIEKVVAG
ncbi:MAG: ABC transporter ATP-binding protein [Thaumarchaeota archaeon]|nr:ABC transporter ATP-binding protein [Nitrososphaerota archaeon]